MRTFEPRTVLIMNEYNMERAAEGAYFSCCFGLCFPFKGENIYGTVRPPDVCRNQLTENAVRRQNALDCRTDLVGMTAVVELVLALVEQQAHERARLVRRVEIGRALRETLA